MSKIGENISVKESINKEFYKNGMNRLHIGSKIQVAENNTITENRVGYMSERKMFRVVRCSDISDKPIKYYFITPFEYEKVSGTTIPNEIKKKWMKNNNMDI
jgi:hypothetical protein